MYRIHQLYSTKSTTCAIFICENILQNLPPARYFSVYVKIFYRSYHLRDRLQWIWCSVCGHSGGKKDAEPKIKALGLACSDERGTGMWFLLFCGFCQGLEIKYDSLVKIASMSWMAIGHCSSFYALCLCFCVFHCGLLCSPFLFLFPNERSGGFNIHIVGKWFQLQRAFHILMTCAELKVGETRSDLFNTTSCLFIYHQHTPLHRLKEGSREGLWFAARFCWMERNFKFKTRNSRHLLICNKSA